MHVAKLIHSSLFNTVTTIAPTKEQIGQSCQVIVDSVSIGPSRQEVQNSLWILIGYRWSVRIFTFLGCIILCLIVILQVTTQFHNGHSFLWYDFSLFKYEFPFDVILCEFKKLYNYILKMMVYKFKIFCLICRSVIYLVLNECFHDCN